MGLVVMDCALGPVLWEALGSVKWSSEGADRLGAALKTVARRGLSVRVPRPPLPLTWAFAHEREFDDPPPRVIKGSSCNLLPIHSGRSWPVSTAATFSCPVRADLSRPGSLRAAQCADRRSLANSPEGYTEIEPRNSSTDSRPSAPCIAKSVLRRGSCVPDSSP